jgi:hypothetical protein
MMKYSGILFFLVTLWMTLSCGSHEGTLIKGRIEHLDSAYLLATYLSSDSLVIDTIQVDGKGRFSYTTNPDTLTAYSLYLDHFESAVVVFADRDERITVKGDASLPDLIAVRGNQVNDDLTLFKSENEDLLKQRALLLDNLSLSSELDSGNNYSRSRQEELLKLNVLNHELSLRAEETIKANPAKMSSLILINSFFVRNDNPVALERVLGYMQGEVLQSELAVKLKAYSEKIRRSAEGARTPYFTLKDKEGKEIRSNDFRGKYLLLSFVSTDGDDSRETVQLLKQEYAELDKERAAFVSIYIDSDIYPVDSVAGDSIPWISVPEKRGWGADIVDVFNIQYIPYNILIDPEGVIKARNIPAHNVTEVIAETFKE